VVVCWAAGIGFRERNEASDFNAALHEYLQVAGQLLVLARGHALLALLCCIVCCAEAFQ
jgi:hypothetical protein